MLAWLGSCGLARRFPARTKISNSDTLHHEMFDPMQYHAVPSAYHLSWHYIAVNASSECSALHYTMSGPSHELILYIRQLGCKPGSGTEVTRLEAIVWRPNSPLTLSTMGVVCIQLEGRTGCSQDTPATATASQSQARPVIAALPLQGTTAALLLHHSHWHTNLMCRLPGLPATSPTECWGHSAS